MYKLFIAFRYLRAHKILYFSIAGVAFGLMTLVVVTSVMGGFSRDLRSRIRGMQAHFVVVPLPSQFWFADYDALCKAIEAVPHVKGCAPRIEYASWLGRGGVFDDVQIVGIVPEAERKVSQIGKYFEDGGKGRFDFTDESGLGLQHPGVVVGSETWRSGKVGLLTARYESGPLLCQRDFEVVGRFKSGMAEYDSKYIFMHLTAAQEFLKVAGSAELSARPRVNTLAIAVDDYEKFGPEVQRGIVDAIHQFDPCENTQTHEAAWRGSRCAHRLVRSWEQTRAVLLQAVEVEKAIIIIVLMMIVLVAGFNIISINTLVVRAKTRDIGILRALGATEGGVIAVFLTVGLLCGLFGALFGTGLGLLLAKNVNTIVDYLRVFTREVNRISYESPGRWPAWVAEAALSLAQLGLLWTWLVFYKQRQKAPWFRMVATGILLAVGTWAATTWIPTYAQTQRHDPAIASRWTPVIAVTGLWVVLMAAWRLLDRWRLHPGWIFFSAAATFLLSVLALVVGAVQTIAAWLSKWPPRPGWHGLSPFPPDIYYLDRIPVYVDYTTLSVIVALTLLISLIFSIYPAIRASRSNPIEAIRDE
jgi:lipoprotein-releasing system permease protein